ncbi:TolC family outer membrane protein [Cupriavidus basilensis]|uniref:TolC family outer membrane protein n=1 Tax=Cupriavidus basilensis TaxID=68895 RepID=UPI0023E86A3F|nr:TolC family outer membrane protein [Cupriavidus basilensis]MDF3886707.1 TolC family outer membrane protein [Cupriavidus basilensis]
MANLNIAGCFARRFRQWAVVTGISLFTVPAAHALGLIEAYEAALAHDPVYAAAIKENEAGQLNRTIGRAYLLPTLSANYADYRNWLRQTYLNTRIGDVSQDQRYRSFGGAIALRQPLVNYEGIARYRYGRALAAASTATFSGKSKDVLVRVLSAYTETLFALDQLTLASAQKRAYDLQLSANRKLLEKGEGTRTDVLETHARSDIADADLISARDAFDNAAHALEAITGIPFDEMQGIDGLSEDFRPYQPQAERLADWRELAMTQNDDLVSARHSVEAARQQAEIQRAGFLPRVDLVASLGQNQSNTVNTINQRYATKAVGIEVTIPIFSGGLVKGSMDQAFANYERAQFDLDDRTNRVMLEVRKQFNLHEGSIGRIAALQRAVESASFLIASTRKSVAGGLRTNVDVLNAERQMYESRRDLARARYQYLLASVQLKYAAGTLMPTDIVALAEQFNAPKGAVAEGRP